MKTLNRSLGRVLMTAMVAGLVAGTRAADELAELARGRLREKLPQLRAALEGRMELRGLPGSRSGVLD